MIEQDKKVNKLKTSLLDARLFHKEQLDFIEDQLALIDLSLRTGRSIGVKGGISILKDYVSTYLDHVIALAEDARKDLSNK